MSNEYRRQHSESQLQRQMAVILIADKRKGFTPWSCPPAGADQGVNVALLHTQFADGFDPHPPCTNRLPNSSIVGLEGSTRTTKVLMRGAALGTNGIQPFQRERDVVEPVQQTLSPKHI